MTATATPAPAPTPTPTPAPTTTTPTASGGWWNNFTNSQEWGDTLKGFGSAFTGSLVSNMFNRTDPMAAASAAGSANALGPLSEAWLIPASTKEQTYNTLAQAFANAYMLNMQAKFGMNSSKAVARATDAFSRDQAQINYLQSNVYGNPADKFKLSGTYKNPFQSSAIKMPDVALFGIKNPTSSFGAT